MYNNRDEEYLERKEIIIDWMDHFDTDLKSDEIDSIIQTYDVLLYITGDVNGRLSPFEEFSKTSVEYLKYEKMYPGLALAEVKYSKAKRN